MSRYVVKCDSSEEMKISVVIPVYNVSAYIERCIRSVMNQTFSDFECILVDDATPDDSIFIAERMIADYQGNICFKIIHHEQNRGLSAARNTGTDVATGDYILYIDSDDEITNDCIEKLGAPFLSDNTIEIVMGNYDRPYEGGMSSKPCPKCANNEDLKSNEAVRDRFFGSNVINVAAWNKLMRRDFLDRFHLSFREGVLWEDFLWGFYAMKHLNHLYIIEDVTYHYYIRPNSISTGTDQHTKLHHWGIVYHEVSNNFTPDDSHREARYYGRQFPRYYINCGHNKLYQETVQNFRRELSFQYDTLIYLRLVVVGILAKTWMGRKVYEGMRWGWKLLGN